MTDDWKPRHVKGMERELAHEEERLKTLDRDRDECRDRIAHLKSQIHKEVGGDPLVGE